MTYSEEMNLPKTLTEAIEQGQTHYFTGKPCKYGHVSKRYTSNRLCCQCNRQYGDKYYLDNHEDQLERRRLWREKNPEYFKNWKKANPEYMSNYCKDWREQNPNYPKLYYLKNSASVINRVSQRRANKLQRSIAGYDEEIEDIYKQCCEVTKKTGIPHHVDHIVPFNGEEVSGLHVPWNLQIITAEENLKKSNKLFNKGDIINGI